MNAAEFLEIRKKSWAKLEEKIETLQRFKRWEPSEVVEFASMYRAACADLALAQEYRLPQETVQYLHQLVARSHNLFYKSQRFQWRSWGRTLFVDVPGRLLRDQFLWLSLFLFWGTFLSSMFLAFARDDFASQIVGNSTLESVEDMYAEPISGRGEAQDTLMAGFYIQHNTGIGLRCFAMGLLLGIGSMYELAYNAIVLGTLFGYMLGTPYAKNFFEFVTAHGPFELTAVAVSAAAGFRLGFSVLHTGGLSRKQSLLIQSRKSLEIVLFAAILFILAAFIEGFVSPSGVPYAIKAGVAILSTILLVLYIVVLGGRAGALLDAT